MFFVLSIKEFVTTGTYKKWCEIIQVPIYKIGRNLSPDLQGFFNEGVLQISNRRRSLLRQGSLNLFWSFQMMAYFYTSTNFTIIWSSYMTIVVATIEKYDQP